MAATTTCGRGHSHRLAQLDLQHCKRFGRPLVGTSLPFSPSLRRAAQDVLGEAAPKADRASRIVDILGFNPDPSRSAEDLLSRGNLLSELHRQGALAAVPQDVATIFRYLEHVRARSSSAPTVPLPRARSSSA
jgi:hypothetical protein